MSEAPPLQTASRLHREAARVAAAIANLIETTGIGRLGAIDDAAGFLRRMAQAAEDHAHRAATDLEPLDRVVSDLGLSDRERMLLVLAGLADDHEGYAAVLRALHPRGEPRATVGLAAQLMTNSTDERDAVRAIVEQGALVRAGVLIPSSDGAFFERSLVLTEGLWSVLNGLDVWPTALRPLSPSPSRAGLQEWLDSTPALRARIAMAGREPRLILITADSEEIALHRAAALALEAGIHAVAVAGWSGDRPDLEQATGVHALARGAVPILQMGMAESNGRAAPAPELVSFPGPVVIAARRGAVRVHGARPVVHVDADRPSAHTRRLAWREILPELGDSADDLAARYTLDPALISEVARDVRSVEALALDGVTPDSLAASVRVRSNLGIAGGFRLRRATAGWDALVLQPDKLAQIREALDRLRHQRTVLDDWGFLDGRPGARGVRMLFSGPPGTGKTLAAEVMASALGVDLLVVDIPRVVSKWIGETEKNLAEVFDAAERAQAVLFFDEADAFFGKRTEVSDAHDRYANFETAYLLSRLESFEGLAILATNLRQNIDPAFLRRLEFVIEFDEPAAAERAAIWRCHVPQGVTLGRDVRLAELAGLYAIVGGLIRNAAVAAAFLAAAEGASTITRQHFLHAIAREYEKTGKAFPGVPAGAAV